MRGSYYAPVKGVAHRLPGRGRLGGVGQPVAGSPGEVLEAADRRPEVRLGRKQLNQKAVKPV